MSVDYSLFDRWWRENFFFTDNPLYKPYRKLWRSGANSRDLTIVNHLRRFLQRYQEIVTALKSAREKKPSKLKIAAGKNSRGHAPQFLKENERLFKLFGHVVAYAVEANMQNVDQVIARAFQVFQRAIEPKSLVKKRPAKDPWKELILEVMPIVPEPTGLVLKYYPNPFSSGGRTPERLQTLILLTMGTYLEQHTRGHKPHYGEVVDILNAQVPPQLKKLSPGSARARVAQFKRDPGWEDDVKTLYLYAHQFAKSDADSADSPLPPSRDR